MHLEVEGLISLSWQTCLACGFNCVLDRDSFVKLNYPVTVSRYYLFKIALSRDFQLGTVVRK
jgi:hypothetical protein